MPTLPLATLTGFLTGGSLILAIGAQNAFLLRQGLMRSHIFWICLVFSLSDAVLIAAGVAGFGTAVAALPWLPRVMTLGGAGFLAYYGFTRLQAAWRGGEHLEAAGTVQAFWPTMLTGLAFTWGNPHVYLDTLALIGAVSLHQPAGAARWAFGFGAMAASFVFFFTLGYGARLLAPLLRSNRAWQVLELVIGLLMWALAAKLLLS